MDNKLFFNSKIENIALNRIKEEKQTIGYYKLPKQDISDILEYIQSIPEDITTVAIIGIGGSSLGAKAIYTFIKSSQKLKRNLVFFESTDPLNIESVFNSIDEIKTHFIVISKSGITIETMAIFKYIYSKIDDKKQYTFITDKNSYLEKFANSIQAKVFILPLNVGGRFSVLSVVGLLPLSMCGIDIQEILDGADSIQKDFFKDGKIQDILLQKASFYAKNYTKYHINCIFAYSESLIYFTQWYIQLWGESLGKKQEHSAFNVGMTPIGLIGPKDQHSFLQLIMDGCRDKSVTFIKILDFENDLEIPDKSLHHLDSLDILNGLSFSNLINMQCNSIIEAIEQQQDIPLDVITLRKKDSFAIGALIYYYELLTSLVGILIDVNTYDQPGVELGKKILKDKLK